MHLVAFYHWGLDLVEPLLDQHNTSYLYFLTYVDELLVYL